MARRLIPGRLLGEAGRPPLTTCTAGRRHIPWRLDDERSWGLVDPSKRDGRGPPPLLVCLIVLEGLARCRRGRRNVVEEGARQLRKNQQGCTHAHYGTLGGHLRRNTFRRHAPEQRNWCSEFRLEEVPEERCADTDTSHGCGEEARSHASPTIGGPRVVVFLSCIPVAGVRSETRRPSSPFKWAANTTMFPWQAGDEKKKCSGSTRTHGTRWH